MSHSNTMVEVTRGTWMKDGSSLPGIALRWGNDTSYRTQRAELLRVAALVEEESEGARWVVVVGQIGDAGRAHQTGLVLIETLSGLDPEEACAFNVLRTVASRLQVDSASGERTPPSITKVMVAQKREESIEQTVDRIVQDHVDVLQQLSKR